MIAPTPKFEFLVESPGKDESQKQSQYQFIPGMEEWKATKILSSNIAT